MKKKRKYVPPSIICYKLEEQLMDDGSFAAREIYFGVNPADDWEQANTGNRIKYTIANEEEDWFQ